MCALENQQQRDPKINDPNLNLSIQMELNRLIGTFATMKSSQVPYQVLKMPQVPQHVLKMRKTHTEAKMQQYCPLKIADFRRVSRLKFEFRLCERRRREQKNLEFFAFET